MHNCLSGFPAEKKNDNLKPTYAGQADVQLVPHPTS